MAGKNSHLGSPLIELPGHVLADLAQAAGDDDDLTGYIEQLVFHRIASLL